jgi:hypothetical protein
MLFGTAATHTKKGISQKRMSKGISQKRISFFEI